MGQFDYGETIRSSSRFSIRRLTRDQRISEKRFRPALRPTRATATQAAKVRVETMDSAGRQATSCARVLLVLRTTRVDSCAQWCAAMVADSLIPLSRLSYGSGRATSCQRVRHAAYLSERDPSEPRRSNSFTRCCRLRHRVDDQLDRLDVCCRSQSVSKRGRADDAFSRRASHASISTLDVRTAAHHGRGHHKIEYTLEASLRQMRPRRLGGHDLSPGRLPAH